MAISKLLTESSEVGVTNGPWHAGYHCQLFLGERKERRSIAEVKKARTARLQILPVDWWRAPAGNELLGMCGRVGTGLLFRRGLTTLVFAHDGLIERDCFLDREPVAFSKPCVMWAVESCRVLQ